MKSPDKSPTAKAKKPMPTHKEIVAKITEENRAFFAKKDKYFRFRKEKVQYPHLESARVLVDSETGTRSEKLESQPVVNSPIMAAPKNILSRLPEGFWATVLVSVLALIVVVGLGYMAVSVLSDVAKLPSSPAAPSGGGDFVLPDPISKLIAFIFLGICLCIYFLPTIVAFRRQKRDCVAIGALNLLLGWTLIGWAVSLVWALKND